MSFTLRSNDRLMRRSEAKYITKRKVFKGVLYLTDHILYFDAEKPDISFEVNLSDVTDWWFQLAQINPADFLIVRTTLKAYVLDVPYVSSWEKAYFSRLGFKQKDSTPEERANAKFIREGLSAK